MGGGGWVMNRSIDCFKLGLRTEVAGHGKDILTDGTNERKRGVQHQGSVSRTLYILVGIRNGDRTHSRSKATTHASHTQGHGQKQRHCARDIVSNGLSPEARHRIQAPKNEHEHDKQQHQIPMAKNLGQEDSPKIAFVLELSKHGGGGAPHGVLEIDRVH